LGTLVPAGGASDDVALLTLFNLPVPEEFSAEFPAEPESLAPIRSMLRRWLAHAGADDIEIAEITTACGEAATKARGQHDRDRGARSRQLALRARGRPRQGTRADAHADGYRCGTTGGTGNDSE